MSNPDISRLRDPRLELADVHNELGRLKVRERRFRRALEDIANVRGFAAEASPPALARAVLALHPEIRRTADDTARV